jgi:glycosyltransferase involved in cell wall biosynthesis
MAASSSGEPRVAERRRIALVESSSGLGGTAKCVRQLVATLDPRRFAPVVFARARVGWYESIEAEGRAAALFYTGMAPSRATGGGRVRSYLTRAAEIARMVPRRAYFRRAFRSDRIDLVHTNNALFEHVPAILAARSLGLPVICQLHDQVPFTRAEKYAARYPDLFFVLSEAARSTYGRDIPANRIRVVHNGLLLSEYDAASLPPTPFAPRPPAVGLVGRLVDWKGHETLLRAVPKILAHVPNATFHLMGDDPSGAGEQRLRLERLAADLGCGGAVFFTGWIADPRPAIARLQVSVCPSTSPEPFGLVILESMALGVPVVASRHGGPLDILDDGRDGLFHAPGDADDLARQITRLLVEPGLASRVAAAARDTVAQRFSMNAIAGQVEESYERLLGAGKPLSR